MKSFEISVQVVKGRVEAEVWKGDMGSLVGLDLENSVFRLRGHFQRGMEEGGSGTESTDCCSKVMSRAVSAVLGLLCGGKEVRFGVLRRQGVSWGLSHSS